MTWNKILEVGYPDDNARVLVWDNHFNEARILVCNYTHACWDTEDGDDYECDWDEDRIPAWYAIERYEGE